MLCMCERARGGGGRKERKSDSEVNQKNPDHKSYDVLFHWGEKKPQQRFNIKPFE